MKKKLEDFTILKYAIDQLMVASLNTDNVYTSASKIANSDGIYLIPIKNFNTHRTYIGFARNRGKLFVLRTTHQLTSALTFRAVCDGTVGEEHSNDIKYYVEIDITDYTSTQLVRFVENREVELINKRRHDIRETWRRESLNVINKTDDKHTSFNTVVGGGK